MREAGLGRAEPAIGECLDIVWGRQIGLALGLQPGDPAPAERVGRRVPVKQMPQEEIRAQRPGQPQGEYPDRGEPHAGVVVKISRCYNLLCPDIKALYLGLATAGCVEICAQPGFGLQAVEPGLNLSAIAAPDGGAHLKPAFPISPPKHLLDEFLAGAVVMVGQHGQRDLLLGNQPVAQVGRQLRHSARPVLGQVVIAPRRIGASGFGYKGIELRKPGGAGWGGDHCSLFLMAAGVEARGGLPQFKQRRRGISASCSRISAQLTSSSSFARIPRSNAPGCRAPRGGQTEQAGYDRSN